MKTSMDEELANVLRPFPAPAALRERLLMEARRVDRPRRIVRRLALAASFVLGAAVLGWYFMQTQDLGLAIAKQAALSHTSASPMDFKGAPPDGPATCGDWCIEKLGYQAPLPMEFKVTQVVGGRACSLKTRPVAYYQMNCGSGLFVFKEPLTEIKDKRSNHYDLPNGYTARMWNEHDHGYLLVEVAGKRP
ncbi:MAG: hypothetical protein Q8O00_01140 [Holophaga sp.]|nr:hypothetical protein [Holophaga sp.]